MTPVMSNADLLHRNATRLGARPMPLAMGEVAEIRRPGVRITTMVLQLIATAGFAALVAAVLWGA